jgi:hypothetical protein
MYTSSYTTEKLHQPVFNKCVTINTTTSYFLWTTCREPFLEYAGYIRYKTQTIIEVHRDYKPIHRSIFLTSTFNTTFILYNIYNILLYYG